MVFAETAGVSFWVVQAVITAGDAGERRAGMEWLTSVVPIARVKIYTSIK